jgi:Secretion system C-terminal sorting domain
MKKVIYTFLTLSVALFFLNNAGGPVVRQQKGYTGAPFDQPSTCATCHNAGSFAPTLKIELFDSLGTNAVTAKYELGKQYTVRLTITAGSGAPSAYGFQLIDVRKKDTSNVKGFLPKAKQDTLIGIDTIATTNRVYAEHNGRLTSNVINVKWKAPTTDLGVIVFYGVGNAANSGGTFAGDNGTASVNLQVASPTVAGVNELAENISIQLSPNPTPSEAVINLDSKMSKNLGLRVIDMSGRAVITEKWQIQRGENKRTLNLGDLVKGVYMIQITENQDVVSKKIIKI